MKAENGEVNFFNSFWSNSAAQETLNSISRFLPFSIPLTRHKHLRHLSLSHFTSNLPTRSLFSLAARCDFKFRLDKRLYVGACKSSSIIADTYQTLW